MRQGVVADAEGSVVTVGSVVGRGVWTAWRWLADRLVAVWREAARGTGRGRTACPWWRGELGEPAALVLVVAGVPRPLPGSAAWHDRAHATTGQTALIGAVAAPRAARMATAVDRSIFRPLAGGPWEWDEGARPAGGHETIGNPRSLRDGPQR
jgi:hypothetical protein